MTKRVGILDLAVDSPNRTRGEQLYSYYFRKQFVSITPQAILACCRRPSHRVHYACYRGQGDPARLLPDDLDVLLVSSYTQASALACALAKLFRKRGTLTIIGGPHARSFLNDCLRFFDLAVMDCDRALVVDIPKPEHHWGSPSAGRSTESSREIHVAKHHSNDRCWLQTDSRTVR